MNIPKSRINANNVSFSGHNKKVDKTGNEVQQFYYLYDPEKYECQVELYNIVRDKSGNINIKDSKKPNAMMPMKGFSIKLNMSNFPKINSDIGFAYRFRLIDKNTQEVTYAFDNGSVIGIFDTQNSDNKYNVVLNNRAIINKNGVMQLIMPDEYYPGVEGKGGKASLNEGLRAKALTAVRTHATKLGGNFYGIIARLPELEKEGVKRIVGTPYTKDTISSHLYWTENAYQTAPNLGTEEDFRTLQRELFKHDMNWIADAALVNEGFGGIHLSEYLRKGQDSFSKNMFRLDEKISLGIIPDKCKFTRMKIINAPFIVTSEGEVQENKDYTMYKPTYIQFYDDRLASEEQKKSASPSRMTTYDNKNTDNIYDITKHDDAVYPFPIEVNPTELERNVKRIVEKDGKLDLTDIEVMKNVSDFTNFKVVTKSDAAGLEVWDGNVDIAKLNFYRCNKDDKRFSKYDEEAKDRIIAEFDKGALAVRDYAINSGKYWTKLTSDTILEYVADLLDGTAVTAEDYYSKIKKLVNAGELPNSVLENIDIEIIENVLDGNYYLRRLNDADMRADINPEEYGNDYELSDYILRKAMEVPLEILPVSTNLLGVITSPYISKKANKEEEIDIPRYDISRAGNPNLPEKYAKVYEKTEKLYEEQIVPFISSVISQSGEIDEFGYVSDIGRYIISEITPDLIKYIFVKALNPDAKIKVNNKGEFNFSNVDEDEITLQSLGIPYSGKSLEEESEIVIDIIRSGIENISEEDKSMLRKKIKERFANRTLNDYKISEMIIDRTEAGQGWRIDAAKDISSIDSVRANADNMTKAWKDVIDFWKQYNQAVLKINPHAYTTAEITDLYDLFKDENKTVFTSDADAERKFLEATGITAVANYNYFFSLLPDLFSNYSFENGDPSWRAMQGKNFELREKMDTGWSGTNPGFLFQSPEDGVVNSYTFVGNHDKPRVIHCLALDMGLFNSDFSSIEHKEAAAKCLRKDINKINFDKVNAKAVAMGTRLNIAFADVLNDSNTKMIIEKAISELASGEFKGKKFDATAFGTRPFEVAIKSVLDQVEYNGEIIEDREEIESKVLSSILTPAYDKYYSIYKLLITLPGSPTDFAGDRVAASGFETKAKNYHQQNRNIIHWEWIENSDSNKYKFIKNFYDNLNSIAGLRNKKELSALNDGATATLPVSIYEKDKNGNDQIKSNEKMQAVIRYNDESVILMVHDMEGSSSPITSSMKRKETETSIEEGSLNNRIILCAEDASAKQGLKHCMKPGTKFRNERSSDSSIYKIAKMRKDGKDYYYLRREDSQGRELPITIKPEDFNTLILYKVS